MRLLDRYLLRELLVPLGFCLCGFLLLWVALDLTTNLHDFQDKKLFPSDILEYYLVITPEVLVLVLPMALLLALLYTLTNHARHHEITAIRAAGISLWRLSLPYFAVGILASLALFAINEFWVPDSAQRAERIHYRRIATPGSPADRSKVHDLGFTNERDRRRWLISVYNPATARMFNPIVLWSLPDGSGMQLQAQRADRVRGIWTFYQASEFKLPAHTNDPPVPLLQTNVLPMPLFSETPAQISSEIKISRMMSLTEREAKSPDLALSEIFNYLRLHPQPSRSDASWLYTKLQGRLALPWTCVIVVLIALPFGAASGRRNVFVGVASSIVICFGFFVLQRVGMALGATGSVTPWLAAWLPNLAFGVTGLWLTAKVR
jgi:lipopolysaccharide export system permease protein